MYKQKHFISLSVLTLLIVYLLIGMFPGQGLAAEPAFLQNGGFEAGVLASWESTFGRDKVSVTSECAHTGDYSVQLGQSSSVQQDASNLQPGATYIATAWVKSAPSNQLRLAVNTYGGAEVFAESTAEEWTQLSVEFTLGASNSTARILLYKAGSFGDGLAWADDVDVVLKPSGPHYPGEDQWVQTLSEEFDGETLDPSLWSVRGQDFQTYVDESCVSLESGDLVLSIKQNPKGTVNGNPSLLGRIDTHGADGDSPETRWSQKYGFFECRAKIPPTEQTYFAFWMTNYPGTAQVGNGGADGCEIDITETVYKGDFTESTLHWDGYGADHKKATSGKRPAPGIHDGYHIYGLQWTPYELIFYFDGVETWRYSGEAVPQVEEIIILSSGFASWGEGKWSNAALPYEARVDWVRAYQKVGEYEPTLPQIYNSGFETGNLSPWVSVFGRDKVTVTNAHAHSGSFSVQLQQSSSVQQDVSGLLPNTTYIVSAWVKSDSGNQIRLTANSFGGAEASTDVGADTWTKASFEFTTGPSNTTARILLYKAGTMGSGNAWVDDLELVRKVPA